MPAPDVLDRRPAGRRGLGRAGGQAAAGAGAMTCVGGSVAVSGVLAHAPLFTAEALRYTAACLILLGLARLTGRRPVMPRGAEWLWLSGIAVTGLVLFNVALVAGARHAEPAVLGVAVACVPPVLAVIGPLAQEARPRAAGVAAALIVTCGAGLVQGLGRTDGPGVAWAAVVFGCECAFTLLAIPVLGRHGPWGVSVHTTWIAAVIFAGIGLVHEGPGAAARLGTRDWLAVGYLAVAVTAAAFVMWYSSVRRLGPAGPACSPAWLRWPRRGPGSCSAARRPARWSGRASRWWPPAWSWACATAREPALSPAPGDPPVGRVLQHDLPARGACGQLDAALCPDGQATSTTVASAGGGWAPA